jgi:DNA replication protein DnaC
MKLDANEREKREAEFRNFAGVPPRNLHCRFDNFDASTENERRALAICRGYAAQFLGTNVSSPKFGVWLVGPCGTGKTHLAVATVYELQMGGRCPTIVGPRRLGQHLLDATSGRGVLDPEADIPEEYFGGCGLLILDDVGAEPCTDAQMQMVSEVVAARYEDGLATGLTSNLSVSEIRAELGDRTFDRLKDGAHLLVLDGASRRDFAAQPGPRVVPLMKLKRETGK